ncbi:MAG: hypothetical protein V1494_06520 [Candidatus Diapherotrites archaeon]
MFRAKNSKRRKIRISAGHSMVESLGWLERKRFKRGFEIVRRVSDEKLSSVYTSAFCLANLLYPKEFPKIIASGLDKHTTYSKRVYLDNLSQKGIEAQYSFMDIGGKFGMHAEAIKEAAEKRAKEIMDESGIEVDKRAFNVGCRADGKGIAFFAIKKINLPRLEIRIRNSMRAGTEKKQALAMLQQLKKNSFKEGPAKPKLIRVNKEEIIMLAMK